MKTLSRVGFAAIILFLLANLLFGGRGDDAEALTKALKSKALIVDVRTQGEFDSWHVKDSINIPYDIIASGITRHQKDKSRPIVVYCRSGNRSSYAKKYLIEAGYTNVVDGGSLGNIRNYTGGK